MPKKYTFIFDLSLTELQNIIKEKAEKNGFFIRIKDKYVTVKKEKCVFNIPVWGQTSFVANIMEIDRRTKIIGKFNASKIFYQIMIMTYVIIAIIYFSATYRNVLSNPSLIINFLLLILFGYLVLKVYLFLCNIIFYKENNIVIDFLKELENEQ